MQGTLLRSRDNWLVLVDNVAEGKPKLAKENYANILKTIEENEKNKATFLVEVASVGSLLISQRRFLTNALSVR